LSPFRRRKSEGIVAWIEGSTMRLVAAVLLIAALFPSKKAAAEERYFALFLAHQTVDRRVDEAHSFIEFIRADVQPDAPPVILQRDTISWLPCDGKVRLLAAHPEAGCNLSLDKTLERAGGRRISAWGPYELTPAAYRMALNRKAELESGVLGYKAAVVVPIRGRRMANCVHAAGEIDPDEGRVIQFELQYGDNAARQLVRHYVRRGDLCNPHLPHDDVYAALGLEGWDIRRRNDWDRRFLGGIAAR